MVGNSPERFEISCKGDQDILRGKKMGGRRKERGRGERVKRQKRKGAGRREEEDGDVKEKGEEGMGQEWKKIRADGTEEKREGKEEEKERKNQ